MKILIIKPVRIPSLDELDDKTGTVSVRGSGAVGEVLDVEKKAAIDLINMRKAINADSDEARKMGKVIDAAQKAEKSNK